MEDTERVTYCGLYCGLCLNGYRIPRTAGELKRLLDAVRVSEWGSELPDFEPFWRFLASLEDFEGKASCRNHACGPEPCAVRDCAEAKGIEVCPLCQDYPCERIRKVAERYPNLIGDGKHLRKIGVARWVEEQKARQARGFAYADIRYDAGDPPADT